MKYKFEVVCEQRVYLYQQYFITTHITFSECISKTEGESKKGTIQLDFP